MFPTGNNAYQGEADIKNLGYVRVFDAEGAHPADQQHIVVGEFGLEGRGAHSSEFTSMSRILAVGAPFEIGDDIVVSYRINVIDDRKVVGVRNECDRHEPMNVKGRRFSILAQNESGIFIHGSICPDYLPNAALQTSVFVDDFARDASDIPETTDFVAPFVTNDGSPFFCADDIHVAGFLSGNDGLKIKDPLHAPTFGGSAIMASGSITYNRSAPCQ
jgi:hypothetical protein